MGAALTVYPSHCTRSDHTSFLALGESIPKGQRGVDVNEDRKIVEKVSPLFLVFCDSLHPRKVPICAIQMRDPPPDPERAASALAVAGSITSISQPVQIIASSTGQDVIPRSNAISSTMMSMTKGDRPRFPYSTSTPFAAANHIGDSKKHLLLAASGSVATIKIPNILHAFSHYHNLSIRLILTKAAENFLAGQSAEQPSLSSLLNIKNVDGIYFDEDEWIHPWTRGGGILHIELRRWADLLVIAPLSANSLAKMTTGLADNLLLSVVRAWDTTGEIDVTRGKGKKKIIVAPAMNTAMWRHPVTSKQMRVLEEEWGVDAAPDGWIEVLRPVEKILACGDAGDGAMKEWKEIVGVVEERLDYTGKA